MAQYARTTTIDVNPGGDSGKQGFIDLDTDLTGIVAAYNAHDAATTSVHGFTGAKTGSGAMVGATSPTLITPLIDHIDEATSAHGVVIDGVTLKDGGALVITGGTNTFNITNGTASLDVAAGKAVNIDDDVTVAAELHVEAATHVNQDLTSDASPTFAAIKLTTGAGEGKILTSDADGDGSWADAPSSTGDFLVMQVFS